MALKYRIDLPLDAPERTVLHGELIKSKRFTRELYRQWYREFTECLALCPEGKFVELGSGGGFLKETRPDVLTSDILQLDSNDLTFLIENR